MALTGVDGVELLWISDYWDGPVTGLAQYRGERLWFDAIWDADADDWTAPRRFRLRRLTEADLRVEEQTHRDFERLVGTHYCLHDLPDGDAGTQAGTGEDFYKLHPPSTRASYDELTVVATFTSWSRAAPGSVS